MFRLCQKLRLVFQPFISRSKQCGESRIQIMFQVIKLFSAISTHFQNHSHTGFDCLFGKKFLLISAAQLEAATCLPSFLVLCTTVHDQAIGTLPQTPSNIYSLYCTMITFTQISSKIPFLSSLKGSQFQNDFLMSEIFQKNNAKI